MARKLYEEADIADIAAAIREKGGTGTYKVAQMGDAVRSIVSGEATDGTESLVTFDQQNPLLTQYLADSAGYSPDDYSVSVALSYAYKKPDYIKCHPVGHAITLNTGGELHLTDGGKVLVKTVAAGDHVLINTTPEKVAHWWLTIGGTTLQNGTIKPVGKVRMIATTAINVRDLGGWSCDGGSVQYGKLFRGGELSESDTEALVGQLDIRYDLDLRSASDNGDITESPLGSEVYYKLTPAQAYYTLANTEYWQYVLRAIFDAVAHDEPLIFHCQGGSDRTGTVACVVEALLGMDQSDIDRDYELSTFGISLGEGVYEAKRRTDIHSDDNPELLRWRDLIEQITSLTVGDTFRDKVVNWVASLGFTADEINAFRHLMIDGNPADVTVEEIVDEGYTLLEYAAVGIDKTGEVDLGYITTANTGFSVTYNAMSLGASGEAQYSGILGNNDIAFGFTTDARAYKGTIKSYALGVDAGSGEHTVKVNYTGSGECSVDGATKSWNAGGSAPSNFNESLRAFSAGSHSVFTKGKAYMATISQIIITESGSVVKTFKAAVRHADGNVGFIEVDQSGEYINGTFRPSTGAVYDPTTFGTMAVMTLEYDEGDSLAL